MPSFAIMPNFKRCQPNRFLVGTTEVSLPSVNRLIMPYPSKIFVQALSTNTASIFIGPTSVTTSGDGAVYELCVGASLYLPSHVIDTWKFISDTPGQNILATYFSGVF